MGTSPPDLSAGSRGPSSGGDGAAATTGGGARRRDVARDVLARTTPGAMRTMEANKELPSDNRHGTVRAQVRRAESEGFRAELDEAAVREITAGIRPLLLPVLAARWLTPAEQVPHWLAPPNTTRGWSQGMRPPASPSSAAWPAARYAAGAQRAGRGGGGMTESGEARTGRYD